MIKHEICFRKKGLSYTWRVKLTFRLVVGDFIHHEFLENWCELQDGKVIEGKFYELFDGCYLIVKCIGIDHNGVVEAWIDTHQNKYY